MCPPIRPATDDTLTIEPPRRLSSGKRVLAAEERAVEIDRHDLPPGGEIGVLDVAERGDARGVDQTVEPAVGAADLGDHAEPVGSEVTSSACVAPCRPARSLVTATPPSALHRLGHGLADRAGRAGDQNDLVLEPVHAASALVIVLVVVVMWP